MLTYCIKTLGCQMNHSDSERISRVLEQSGFSSVEEVSEAKLLIINTCSVRQKAEDRAYGFIKQYKDSDKNLKIAVTGCMVRQTGDKKTSKDPLLKMDPIDIVFRIEDTARIPKILESHFKDYDSSVFAPSFGDGSIENYFNIVPKTENKVQVFVPIMQGCNKFCTFCIVPYTRGREISRPMKDVLAECEKHVENGAKEITLLGQNVNSYRDGTEGKKCFARLLQEVDKLYKKGLSRLRFTSAHPQDFTNDVIEALATMKTSCPYMHLPVQHGSDEVLRAMNRNYKIEDFKNIIKKVRARIPNMAIATDIIVGFPGETEAQFLELCDFARELQFDFSYTAIYSPRKNTPAQRMSELFIDLKTKKERFHRFDEVVKEFALKKREEKLGKVLEILVEKSEPSIDGMFFNTGRSREFFEVSFLAGRNLKGKEVEVKITEQKGFILKGAMPEQKGLNIL